VAPTESERKFLATELKLDEHTLNSALDPDELARLEFEPEHTALIIKRPKNYSSEDNFLFKVASVGLFIFKDRLVVVVADDAPLFEGREFGSVRSIQDIVLRVIYRSIFHFEGHLRVISALSDELETEINKAMENKHLLNLFTLEKSLVYYLNAISTNGRVIEKLKTNAARLGLTPEQMEFLDDITIENNQCYELAQIYSQVLSSLMDARVSVVSNNLNVLMKTLTLVMIAIMLPTLVISAFSMNVKLPLDQEIGTISFWVIMGLAAASVVSVWLVWRYRKW
jgi:magnesium transporter